MTPNNRCDKRQLILYHYNELESAERRLCEQHLEQCPRCRAALEQTEACLEAFPTTELRLDPLEKNLFGTRVIEGIQSRRQWRIRVWGGSLVAAGAVAVTIFLLPLLRQPAVTPTPAFADLEVIEQLDFLQNFEVLQDLDLLEVLGDMG